jgi:hypothetical protein
MVKHDLCYKPLELGHSWEYDFMINCSSDSHLQKDTFLFWTALHGIKITTECKNNIMFQWLGLQGLWESYQIFTSKTDLTLKNSEEYIWN